MSTGAAAPLSRTEKSVFISSGFGWLLDSMDISMFSLVVPSLLIAFSIGRGQVGLLATAALLSSAIGGWIAGIVSDRIGRMIVLRVTIAWFSLATIACAFVHDYNIFLGVRIIQGLGFGGEWAVGAVLMAEIVRSEKRGRVVGMVQSCYSIGWAVALLLFYLLFQHGSDPESWRTFFIISGCLGLPLFLYRLVLRVPEAPRMPKGAGGSFEIFGAAYLRKTILAAILCMGFQSGAYCILVWLPTFLLNTKHLSIVSTSSYLAFFVAGSFIGMVAGAYLSDIIGRRRKIMLFSLGSFVMVIAYLNYPSNGPVMIALGFLLGLTAFGIYPAAGPLLSELYPRRIRGAGQGFCYNFGRGIGAVLPAVIGFASARLGLGEAIAVFSGVAYLFSFAAAFLLPETRGLDLATLDEDARREAPTRVAIEAGAPVNQTRLTG